MTITVEFPTIEARDAFLQETPPEGLSFYVEMANAVTVGQTTYTVLSEIALPIALNVVAAWLYDIAKKHKAESIAVDGHKATDEAQFKRIVASTDLEMGKND